MKIIAQIGAVFSSASFLIAGGICLAQGANEPGVAIFGLCLLGMGFFLGPMLWLAGERWSPRRTGDG